MQAFSHGGEGVAWPAWIWGAWCLWLAGWAAARARMYWRRQRRRPVPGAVLAAHATADAAALAMAVAAGLLAGRGLAQALLPLAPSPWPPAVWVLYLTAGLAVTAVLGRLHAALLDPPLRRWLLAGAREEG